jgi:hypothetical protein
VLVLDMIGLLPPLGLNKYDTWRILLVKCYIDNFVHLQSCIRNVNSDQRVLSSYTDSCVSFVHGFDNVTPLFSGTPILGV